MNKIVVRINDKEVSLDVYSTVEEALVISGCIEKDYKYDYLSNPIVGCIVEGEAYPLGKRIAASSTITPIFLFDPIGRRIYRHSICFLLSLASFSIFPERKLVIGHSLGDGYYFSFEDDEEISEVDVIKIKEKMLELVSSSLPIEYKALSGEEAINMFKERGMYNTNLLLSSRNDSFTYVYSLSSYYQVSYEPLVANTSILSVWELSRYNNKGLLLRYPVSENIKSILPFKDNPLLFKVFEEYKRWGRILKVRSVGELNRISIDHSSISEYVKLSEDLHRRKIASIADNIDKKKAKIVFVAGPSSSGKTTFAKRLCEQLRLLGYEPFKISLDDYYNAPWDCPKDSEGKPDLETIEALNLKLIDKNMSDLVEGRSVNLPSYDFNTHITTFSSTPVRMSEKTIIVVEGIHALNNLITGCIDSKYIYKVYISALTQLNLDDSNRVSTSDNRLMRRIIRDYRTRGMSAERTLGMWSSVTRGEIKHIFPHQNNADVMFNSALDYEIAVLSPFLQPLLRSIKKEEGASYVLSRRLLAFLENVYPVSSVLVPSDSLLREFIGESDYE